MNAPASAAAVAAAPTLVFIALAKLKPSGTHIQALRRQRFDEKALEELAESVKKVGILQPLVGRPDAVRGSLDWPQGGVPVKVEIVAGERRYLAARLAGLATVPVNVAELTDEQVIEIQLIENLQREGLHELEEAEGYEELMRLKKIDADALAELVGRSRSYVYARRKLLALCHEARKAFYAGELDASRALLVARIGHHDTQRQALADLTKGYARWGRREGGPMSYREAHKHVLQHYMLKLKEAPFDIGDAQLVAKAGTCAACPKRTGNERDLFGDVKDADVCTDPKCFDDKRQAHYAGARRSLEAAGKKVIYGDAAKKLLPHWDNDDHYNLDRLAGGYVRLNDTTYASGRHSKVSELLGDAYEPILIQHPGSGKIIEAATQQAVAKASQSPARSGSARAAKTKPKGPDVDAEEFKALLKLIHEKAPKKFGRQHLRVLAARLFRIVNPRRYGMEAMKAAWKWSSLRHDDYYRRKLPKESAALDERGLLQFMLDTLFVGCYSVERKPFLDLFGVKESKVRAQVIEERKTASAAARAATKPLAMRIPAGEAGFKAAAGLAGIVGTHPLTKAEALKRVQAYIVKQGLQKDKAIRLDTKLKAALRKSLPRVDTFELAAMVNLQLTLAVSASVKPAAKYTLQPKGKQT